MNQSNIGDVGVLQSDLNSKIREANERRKADAEATRETTKIAQVFMVNFVFVDKKCRWVIFVLFCLGQGLCGWSTAMKLVRHNEYCIQIRLER